MEGGSGRYTHIYTFNEPYPQLINKGKQQTKTLQ